MTLGQALGLAQRGNAEARRRKVFLVCGFQPLHLATFLQGHFAARFPGEAADIRTGLYGDLEGTLLAAADSEAEAAVVVIEWADLDPRLGLRSAGNWALSAQADIIAGCQKQFDRLLKRIESLAARMPMALVPPTLPIPLLGHTAGWQWSLTELELQKQAASFLVDASRISGVAILSASVLARMSPESARLDAAMELNAGFPYTIQHASAVASQIVKLLFSPSPMKGLITDLDDTLWSGIVGEVGVGGVCWSLADHAQIHGLYQQVLRHLSEMGVLLGVVSKNEPAVVEEALRREDLLIPAQSLFPVISGWGPKSDSISAVLRRWNVGAESVVFVDDSAMELEEVRTAFPAMTCLQFSRKHPTKTLEMFQQLRDLFGKPTIQSEDSLRQTSIRRNAIIPAAAGSERREFVRSLEGRLTFDCRKDPANKRLLELINKTNQFNLNGVRVTEGEWMRHLADPASLALNVSYEDKFGQLGIIGVVAGKMVARQLEISVWVMSCRAFSRRIEYHTLEHLFRSSEAELISFLFRSTERNAPFQQFLQAIRVPAGEKENPTLSRETFLRGAHELPHRVVAREDTPQPDARAVPG